MLFLASISSTSLDAGDARSAFVIMLFGSFLAVVPSLGRSKAEFGRAMRRLFPSVSEREVARLRKEAVPVELRKGSGRPAGSR